MTEEETEDHIARLNAEIKRLRADVDGLRAVAAREQVKLKKTIEFLNSESDDITRHIRIMHRHTANTGRHLVDIYKYLWPLIDRVLPQTKKDMGRFHELVREHNGPKKP